jgi:chemotaxis protein CheX
MEVEDFDEIAKSAESELTNMLTATQPPFCRNRCIHEFIPQTMLEFKDDRQYEDQSILCIELLADNVPVEVYVSLNNI